MVTFSNKNEGAMNVAAKRAKSPTQSSNKQELSSRSISRSRSPAV